MEGWNITSTEITKIWNSRDAYLKPSLKLPLQVAITIWDTSPDLVDIYYLGEEESSWTLKGVAILDSWKHEVLKEYFLELSEVTRTGLYSGFHAETSIVNPQDREFLVLFCRLKDSKSPIWKEIFKMIIRKEDKEEIINTLSVYIIAMDLNSK